MSQQTNNEIVIEEMKIANYNSAAERLEQATQPKEPDYAWHTIEDYERDVGFKVSEAFKMAWCMARTTNGFLKKLSGDTTQPSAQPASVQGPVGEAYLCDKCQTPFDGAWECPNCGHRSATKEPVYTTPPAAQRQWDYESLSRAWYSIGADVAGLKWDDFVAKLREENGGCSMNPIEAMKQMVEALEKAKRQCQYHNIAPHLCYEDAIQAGRQAIAEAEKQEPVAWLVEFENGEQELHFDEQSVGETQIPLYTHPQPKREPLWIDPNDKTQAQFLPHIGEPILFCHGGKTYYGHHNGGSFQYGYGVTKRYYNTWECRWMYFPAAHGIGKGEA